MSISKFEFTRRWTNPTEFHTYETSEEQVRSDMQALHDEARNYIDEKLIPEVENELALKATKDEIRGIVLGQIPDGTLTRDKLSAELQAELDYKATQAQVEDRYTKAEIWSTETRGNLGLEEGAVPEDMLRKFSELNLHTWLREAAEPAWESVALESTTKVKVLGTTTRTNTTPVELAQSVTVDAEGNLVLVDPISFTVGYSVCTSRNNEYDIIGKYVRLVNQDVVYLATSEFTNATDDDTYLTYINGRRVIARELSIGDQTQVRSRIRDAYPDNDVVENYHYTYLGVPLEKVDFGLRVQTGTYTGTGTKGVDNPNTVTLGFVPKLFLVMHPEHKAHSNTDYGLIWLGQPGATDTAAKALITVTGTTVSWYATDVDAQLNTTGVIYHYFALG